MSFLPQRRASLTRDFKKDNTDAILVTNAINVSYLTGFTGDSSYFLITTKQAILISDDRYSVQIGEECPGLEVYIRPHNQTLIEAVGVVLGQAAVKAVGVESNHVSLALLEDLKTIAPKGTNFVPLKNKVELLRMLKDPGEVEAIRSAVKVAERAFYMFKSTLRDADTEKDLVDAMEAYVRRAGGECTSFPPIVAIGERGALPHARPTNLRMDEGSKVLVDWGAVLKGYRSDLTRTFRTPFQVSPSRKNRQERVGFDLERIHDALVRAQDEAIKLLREGVTAKEVDDAARTVLAETTIPGLEGTLNDYFTHGLGHGIGLETHELPRIRQNSTDVLEAGMVVTIEPGVYIPGWGGVRVEDNILIRRDGSLTLSSLSRDCTALVS